MASQAAWSVDVRATGCGVCVSQQCGLLLAGEGVGALLGTLGLRSMPRSTDDLGGLSRKINLSVRCAGGMGATSCCVCVPQHCGLWPVVGSLGALLGTVVPLSLPRISGEVRERRLGAASSRSNMHGFTSIKSRQWRLNTLAWKRGRRHSGRRETYALRGR